MISCRKASELVSQSQERRLALAIHLLTCGACRRFRAQVTAIRAATSRRVSATQTTETEVLSVEGRQRIGETLARSAGGDPNETPKSE